MPPREAETRADLVAKIAVKAIVTDRSPNEAKERREPRMTKIFGRVFERFKTAYADTMVRPIMIA